MTRNLININPQMQKLADNAVTAAREKFGISLDLTEYSLQQLEILLQQAHEAYQQRFISGSSQKIPIETTVRVWGSYFGEVIRRSLGGGWIADQKEVFLQLGSRRLDPLGQVRSRIVIVDQRDVFLQLDSQRVDPLGQVRSRIVDGELYNVQSFFQGIKSGIQNKPKGQVNGLDSEKNNSQNVIVEKKIKYRTATYVAGILGTIILVGLCLFGIWILCK
jgi:hypothetical protein